MDSHDDTPRRREAGTHEPSSSALRESDAVYAQDLVPRGDQCCQDMAYALAEDRLPVCYDPQCREWSVEYADGSFLTIQFCPWCGTRLPASLRDELLRRLAALGVDLLEEEVPPELRGDAWWRQGP